MAAHLGKIAYFEASRRPRGTLTCIDLFSGAGGLAEGFRQAGWAVLAGNDIDHHAGLTFRQNFPEAHFYEGPITALKPSKVMDDLGLASGELDCLIGGPPCQSFSYNNHQRSATDDRARLFKRYLHFVKSLQPKVLVMENVPGMLTIGNGEVIKQIERKLARLGYRSAVRILYSEEFGTPQARRRVFIVASRTNDPSEFFPTGTHGPISKPPVKTNPFVHHWESKKRKLQPLVTVWDAIGDLPPLIRNGGSKTIKHSRQLKTDYQRRARRGTEKLFDHVTYKLNSTMLKRIAHVPEGGNWTHIPVRLLPSGMRRARRSDHTKRYGRLRRKGLASTILTKCDPHWGAYVHPTQQRTISVREAARLQGFPDNFVFAGDFITKQYEQVGNAVPIPVAAAMAKSVRQKLRPLKN